MSNTIRACTLCTNDARKTRYKNGKRIDKLFNGNGDAVSNMTRNLSVAVKFNTKSLDRWLSALLLLTTGATPAASAASWGASYFNGAAFAQRRASVTVTARSSVAICASASSVTAQHFDSPAFALGQQDFGTVPVPVLPAGEPLSSFVSRNHGNKNSNNNTNDDFSVLSWNILLPNSHDNWWNHKMYSSWVPMEQREWLHRQALLEKRLLHSNADIVCIQEAAGDTFDEDFAFMKHAGYAHVLHKKFRFRCATFFKQDKFVLEQESHKDRTLVTALGLKTKTNENENENEKEKMERLITIVNCHLSGGAAPDRRLRQVHEALDQIRKWQDKAQQTMEKQQNANRPNPKNMQRAQHENDLYQNTAVIVCGDFNSDGNTGVRRLLVDGSVDPEWREPQYPSIPLTSKMRQHSFQFQDAAELAYGANVCDGDYGQDYSHPSSLLCRPATYVVPNLASLLLLPLQGQGAPRTEFGYQVAHGIATTLGMKQYTTDEICQAFDKIDLDGNGIIDQDEVQQLLEVVYEDITHGQPEIIEKDRKKFFGGFYDMSSTLSDGDASVGLSREQFEERLRALQQQLEGGNEGVELVEIQTDIDVQRMVDRFTPILRESVDQVFDQFSSDGKVLTQADVDNFLIQTNGQIGRGGMWRHTQAMFEKKAAARDALTLSHQDWYAAFARELGEGKWWQVVYDLEVCGANLRSKATKDDPHYQGWLDYLYFDSQHLHCSGVQEALTESELATVYNEGDALPNAWHPSDHLPVAGIFSWQQSVTSSGGKTD